MTMKISKMENLQNVLTHAVTNKNGYMKDLKKADKLDGQGVEMLKTIGFIKTGNTQQAETFGITKLGQEYFNDFYANNKKTGLNAIG